jgi:hypothetical protein
MRFAEYKSQIRSSRIKKGKSKSDIGLIEFTTTTQTQTNDDDNGVSATIQGSYQLILFQNLLTI